MIHVSNDGFAVAGVFYMCKAHQKQKNCVTCPGCGELMCPQCAPTRKNICVECQHLKQLRL